MKRDLSRDSCRESASVAKYTTLRYKKRGFPARNFALNTAERSFWIRERGPIAELNISRFVHETQFSQPVISMSEASIILDSSGGGVPSVSEARSSAKFNEVDAERSLAASTLAM